MKEWSDIGSTCKFRNARSAFRNLHVDPLSLHTFMRNKQVEFNPYIYTLTTLSRLYRFGYEISVFLIQNTRSLFYGYHYSPLHRLMSFQRKLNVKIFLMFIVAENTGSVNIIHWGTFTNFCFWMWNNKSFIKLTLTLVYNFLKKSLALFILRSTLYIITIIYIDIHRHVTVTKYVVKFSCEAVVHVTASFDFHMR